ncbi:uncharacterized protein LOC143627678 [Bidens hawaiensis]|uniref:uncharacterized protein LOC143627678 n=1 Tax=Bidens hawaiensis TaxID=980011 RepID=UPI00404B7930
MDLFGPVHVLSLSRNNHCLVITYDYSRFTWVFFLSNKGETAELIKKFVVLMENQLNLKLKGIRWNSSSIQLSSYPQQNGVAERRNRTLIEAARTIVYNKASKHIVESFDVRWLEENETDARVGPNWLFDYNKLFRPFNVFLVVDSDNSGRGISTVVDDEEDAPIDTQESLMLSVDPFESLDTTQPSSENLEETVIETVSPQRPSTAEISPVEGERFIHLIFGSTLFPDAFPNEYVASTSYSHSTAASGWKNPLIEALEDPTNLPANCSVPGHSIPSRIQRDYPIDSIVGPIEAGVSTRSQTGTINNCLCSCFISQIEPKTVDMALQEPSWVDTMHEELDQFEKLEVGRATRCEGGKFYVDQPPGFVDSKHPSHIYKLDKALYGLHQAPRAWYATLTAHLLEHGYKRGTIDQTLFIKIVGKDLILVQIYVDDIIFGSTCTTLCSEFEEVCKIYGYGGKFEFQDSKSAATPMVERPLLLSDPEGKPVEQAYYRSMIGSLMYLTASHPDIMFAPKNLEFDLYTFADSNYGGHDIDRKSTSAGCHFLGDRLNHKEFKSMIVGNGLSLFLNPSPVRCYYSGINLTTPTEFPVDDVAVISRRMNYEGAYPPAIKKLFHPYWRFLIHTFFACVSGRKGRTDEISLTQMLAATALIMDWDYNYSKFVFDEMLRNLQGKKKELFLYR